MNSETVAESDQSLLLERGVSVAGGIVHLKRGKSHVSITNFTEDYQHLSKDASIAFLDEIRGESDVIVIADEPFIPDVGELHFELERDGASEAQAGLTTSHEHEDYH